MATRGGGGSVQSSSDLKCLDESHVIAVSHLNNKDPVLQMNSIVDAFNTHLTGSSLVKSNMFGSLIPVDEFLLVHKNNVPELACNRGAPVRKIISPGDNIEEVGRYKQTSTWFGAHGIYVVNVPVGDYGLSWSGITPLLLGEGCHVLHDPNFRFERLQPVNTPYFNHGTLHFLRVPMGMLAKVWHGSEALILEGRMQPYIFNTPLFKLDTHGLPKGIVFFNASEKLVVHSNLKRIMPHTGEVAVTYNNGQLAIFEQSPTGTPIIISSATHIVDGFLSVNTETLIFPSSSTQKARKKENPKDKNYKYEVFRTKDGMPVGLQILAVYNIADPHLTLTRLQKGQVVAHIESVVVADMGVAIQSCACHDLQNTDLSKTSERNFLKYFQDSVRQKLKHDLQEYGIALLRLNIETPKILDETVASQVAKMALITAQADAQASAQSKQLLITQSRAAQQAEQERIEQERCNKNIVDQARAEAISRQFTQAATLESARMEAEAVRIKASAEADASKLLTCAQEKEAEMIYKYAVYSKLRQAEMLADSLSRIPTCIVPDNSIFAPPPADPHTSEVVMDIFCDADGDENREIQCDLCHTYLFENLTTVSKFSTPDFSSSSTPTPIVHTAAFSTEITLDPPKLPVRQVDITPEAALLQITKGNARFVSGALSTKDFIAIREALSGGQHPYAAVVTCTDSRVCPEMIFDTNLGDLFVIRTAGNVVRDVELGSLEYAVTHVRVPLVIVLGHTKCGAIQATCSQLKTDKRHKKCKFDSVMEEIMPSAKLSHSDLDRTTVHHVTVTARKVRDNAVIRKAFLSGRVAVVPMVYNITSGHATRGIDSTLKFLLKMPKPGSAAPVPSNTPPLPTTTLLRGQQQPPPQQPQTQSKTTSSSSSTHVGAGTSTSTGAGTGTAGAGAGEEQGRGSVTAGGLKIKVRLGKWPPLSLVPRPLGPLLSCAVSKEAVLEKWAPAEMASLKDELSQMSLKLNEILQTLAKHPLWAILKLPDVNSTSISSEVPPVAEEQGDESHDYEDYDEDYLSESGDEKFDSESHSGAFQQLSPTKGGKKKGKTKSKQKQKTDVRPSLRKRRKRKTYGDLSDDDRDNAPQAYTVTSFWAAMEQYLRPLSEKDLDFFTPREDDIKADLPPLGVHYSISWSQDDDTFRPGPGGSSTSTAPHATRHATRLATSKSCTSLHEPMYGISSPVGSSPSSSLGGGSLSTVGFTFGEQDSESPSLGDITQRLLAAMITTDTKMDPPKSIDSLETPKPLDASLFTGAPILEDKVKTELKSIGFLDPHFSQLEVSGREDDEVSESIRARLVLLREQREKNNKLKAAYFSNVKTMVQQHRGFQERYQQVQNLDDEFKKFIAKQNRKRRKAAALAKEPLGE
ncbi:vacuolin A [Pelomyxa schiedti]|nr:vacuolin A [Pelomyxa schiedti]